ncbi:DoxX family protein [Nocardia yamanashiensis]|uniref:DoxX family protein n=1 Tax=Nocardia yamanashiensis TaxID=209247 RepID=UPI001E2BA470|nr:DoxX family protein [Nocardia yamanashiensis]UGT44912.1 DoxX family protein [Nocardia yamanashiensis]
MKTVTKVLGGVLAAEFLALGTAKVAGVASMRERAAHLGYSTTAYRGIGAVELVAAGGLLLGPIRPAIGRAAGAGLVLMMTGAVASHLRNRDSATEIAPAAATALAAAAYVATFTGGSR